MNTTWIIFLLTTAILALDNKKFYEIFDIDPKQFKREDTREEAKKDLVKAYRKLAQKWHPDKNQGDKEAEKKFIEITKAFEVLKDDEKRNIYDRYGEEGVDKASEGGGGAGYGGFSHAEDIFRQFFDGDFADFFGGGMGGGGGGGRRGPQRGPDAKMEVEISLEEACKGKTMQSEFPRQLRCTKCNGTGAKDPKSVKECPDCRGKGSRIVVQQLAPGFIQQMQVHCQKCAGKGRIVGAACGECQGQRVKRGKGSITINIPPGCPHGHHLHFPGQSDEQAELESGDLYVLVSIQEHPKYRRDGAHLYVDVYLTLAEALLGFEKKLTHLDDRKLTIKRKEVTQPGYTQVMKEEGMPRISGGRGDLYVTFQVVLPENLSKSQINDLTKLLKPPIEHDEL